MNMLTLIRSLRTRATALEAEVQALRAEANQLSALVLGEGDAAPAPSVTPEVPVAPEAPKATTAPEAPKATTAPPKPPLPSKAEILAKAKTYNVDISEFFPADKKPTDQQKTAAIRKIALARRAQEQAALADDEDEEVAPATPAASTATTVYPPLDVSFDDN